MENTINDLYLKYVNSVGESLEDDRYFQYLFEMIQAGSNTLHQTNKILHKVVDERWLTTIEESLDAINAIIDKPRRFITTTEEVVPVALAKKITADSVRHLSMNTQFIASNEDGDIHPTRVLNVTTDESYDLYENRFVYHLIQRLVTFIDKRTDVIFWSTGDEISNTLKMESKVDDAYEEIEYKIEMKIKNRQSFAENDSDNLQVFMRIDRVRRLVMALRNSSFCSLMAGCSKVRSPIQRTNLMMKDPNYRTCYKLWQFLESYDEVGYTIEERDSALEFDEEYLIQMYINLITNYTVFKSLLEGDPRNLEEIEVKEREVVKPKFIKQIEEEIVDDYNIPDVEVRKVIIEEVTQAQLDAEAKLEEETALRKAAEEARENAELQLESERWKMQMETFEIQQTAEEQVKAAEEKAANEIANAQIKIEKTEREAKEKLEEQMRVSEEELHKLKKTSEEELNNLRQTSEEKLNNLRQTYEEETHNLRQTMEEEISRTKLESEERIAHIREESDSKVREARQMAEAKMQEADVQMHETRQAAKVQMEEARQMAEARMQEAEMQMQEIKQIAKDQVEEAEIQMQETRQTAQKEVEEAKKQAFDEIEEIRRKAQTQILEIKRQAEKAIQEAEERASQQVQEAENKASRQVQEAENKASRQVQEAEERANQQVREAEAKASQAVREAEIREKEAQKLAQKETKARLKAEAKADENRMSNRITDAVVRWLDRRNSEKENDHSDNPEE